MKVFLSSSFADLAEHRRAAWLAIEALGHSVTAMESFGSSGDQPISVCLQRVAESDIVICLIATHYGSLTSEGISFTEAEVRHAGALRVPVLGYFLDEEQPVLPRFVSQGQSGSRLAEFKQWMQVRYTMTRFGTPDDLARKIGRDLQAAILRIDAAAALHTRLRATADRELDILAVTAHNLDYIHQVDQIAPDHEAAVDNPVLCPGGSGANTICALSRLGLRAAALGILADDRDGARLARSLAEYGVRQPLELTVPSGTQGTGRAMVYSDRDGRRLIYVRPGVNETLAHEIRVRRLRPAVDAALAATRIVHLTSFTGADERLLQEGLAQGLDQDTVLTFTPGSIYAGLGADRLVNILRRTNMLFLYEHQLDQLIAHSSAPRATAGSRELTDKLDTLFSWRRRRGIREPLVVAVKRPAHLARGRLSDYLSVASGRDQLEEFIRAETVAHDRRGGVILDSTGAGDALAAGMIFAFLRGRPLNECADAAFVMAITASGAVGARTALPHLAKLPDCWPFATSGPAGPDWLTSEVG